jgi:hypothetical protein
MNNKLRIKRIKAGIKMLEKGICPSDNFNTVGEFEKYYGVNISGCLLLVTNHATIEAINAGFIKADVINIFVMLHNWNTFLKLIEKL